jgi:hypothetical protein
VLLAHESLIQKHSQLAASDSGRTTAAFEKSAVAFKRVVDTAKSLVGTGSGKVPLLLPSTHVKNVTQAESEGHYT